MRLHHIGVVVKDIERSRKIYEKILGLRLLRRGPEDPFQKVKALFLGVGWGEGIVLELLEPTDETSPILSFLKRGGGIHHLCFEVEDIDRTLEEIKGRGGRVVCEPLPAVGFDNRRIAFIFPVDSILVELLERK